MDIEAILENAMVEPRTIGVILLDDLSLCVASRGELREPDALRIADLLERAGVIEDKTGEIRYGDAGRYLQFHHTAAFTLAILKSPNLSPTSSSQESSSLGTIKQTLSHVGTP